jgi:2',3'-cyclic-nucleotide 2'-phosphodiesterase (5'-nucleotidase family)
MVKRPPLKIFGSGLRQRIRTMKIKSLFLTLLLLLGVSAVYAQINYSWTTVAMDASWGDIKDFTATKIISKYEPMVAPLMEIIGYSEDEYDKGIPEGPLSNFAVDVIRAVAEKETGSKVDVAMTNFGGIRTSLPKGAVRVYDIFSIFPFDNYLVTFDISGADLDKFLRNMASRGRVEALSNVKVVFDGYKLESLTVGGEAIDPEKNYKFATINFLMDGGDRLSVGDFAKNITNLEHIFIRDAIVDYVREMTARGEIISLKNDGRVIIKNREDSRR